MRRNIIPIFVAVLALAGILTGWLLFQQPIARRYNAAHTMLLSRSEIYLAMAIKYGGGPIVDERYSMQDINGVSSSTYVITGADGQRISITAPPEKTTEVSFFFDKVVQDGIWKIVNQPPRGDTSQQFTISIRQVVQKQAGSRTVKFTDPHYWAVTAGRQYQIHLDPHKPTPDLLKLKSTSLADPRYLELVHDFRTFGPVSFRSKIARAQIIIGTGR
ncbi:MAG: hypothetical protein ABI182_01175 [Candidatus Baltobacteraceae bacterium]